MNTGLVIRRPLVGILALLLLPASLYAQGTGRVRGTVTDAATGAPVSDAPVSYTHLTLPTKA